MGAWWVGAWGCEGWSVKTCGEGWARPSVLKERDMEASIIARDSELGIGVNVERWVDGWGKRPNLQRSAFIVDSETNVAHQFLLAGGTGGTGGTGGKRVAGRG
jgi:hypothetical protein